MEKVNLSNTNLTNTNLSDQEKLYCDAKEITSNEIIGKIKEKINKIYNGLEGEISQLEKEIFKIISEFNKDDTVIFLEELEKELRQNAKFKKIIGKGKTESVIKNVLTHDKNFSIHEEKKFYMNLYSVISKKSLTKKTSTKTVTKLSIENIILLANFLTKNNFDLKKILGSSFDAKHIPKERQLLNTQADVNDSLKKDKTEDFFSPFPTAKIEKVRVSPSTGNRGDVIYFDNISDNNNETGKNIDSQGVDIIDFLPILQNEINKILLETYKGSKTFDEKMINSYLIHEGSLDQLFLGRKDRKIYTNMFDKLPKRVKESKSWTRILNLLSGGEKKDKNIGIAKLNDFVSIHLNKNKN